MIRQVRHACVLDEELRTAPEYILILRRSRNDSPRSNGLSFRSSTERHVRRGTECFLNLNIKWSLKMIRSLLLSLVVGGLSFAAPADAKAQHYSHKVPASGSS